MTKALSSVLYIARTNGIPTTIQEIGRMIFCNPTLLDCTFTDLKFDVFITFPLVEILFIDSNLSTKQ